MAYTVDQSSGTGVQGVADDIYYQVRDTSFYADPKYRYLVRLTIDSVVIGTFKQLPNSANCAVFRIQDIISDYVQQDETILRLGQYDSDDALSLTTIFALNEKAIETVSVEFGYEKAATVNDAPVQTFLPALDTTLKAINGSLRSLNVNSNAINSAAYYKMTSTSGRFLSVLSQDDAGEMPQWVLENQFGALAFLNGDDVGGNYCDFFHVSYFDAAGGALNTNSFENNPTNGGVVPAAGLSDEASILYFGAFPLNLEFQTIAVDIRPSNNSGWDYYEVQAASSATLAGNEASRVYRFNKLCNTRYNQSASNIPSQYFLSWWNEVGGIDNLLCDGASNVTQSIQRNSFRSMGGHAFKASGTVPYSKGSQEGGMTSVGNLTTTSITLNTRENNPTNLNNLIMSLVNSPRVYVYTSALQQAGLPSTVSNSWIRCIVKGAQIGYKTALNDKISNYTIEIEISRRKPNVQ
jgi:hypothetical protein